MEKKMYEAPQMDEIQVKMSQMIAASVGTEPKPGTPAGGREGSGWSDDED